MKLIFIIFYIFIPHLPRALKTMYQIIFLLLVSPNSRIFISLNLRKIQIFCCFQSLRKTGSYLLFFSLFRLINAMINLVTPAHSHIIPIAVFSAQNQAGDRIIHIIAKIKFPLLLMIISPKNSNNRVLNA